MPDAAPIVRVPLNDFALVSRALDFGAEAIIAPMINDADDASRLRGRREISPRRRAKLGAFRAMALQGTARRSTTSGRRTAALWHSR